MESQTPKRRYNSARRKEQARQTRQQIIEAAGDLFFENGYSGTSMEAIAQAAGVAVETVYAAFGSKVAVLNALVSTSIVGDDLPIPLLQRNNIQAASRETDPHQMIRRFASDIYPIMQRMSPIFALLRATAKTEPDIAPLLDKLLAERLQGMVFFVEQLKRTTPLVPALEAQAAETIWTLTSAEIFHLLIVDLGWSEQVYVNWLEKMLSAILIP